MGRRHVDPPRTIDLVIDEPQGRLSPTILRGIRHDLRQPQHVHATLLRTLQLRVAGTPFEEDVADVLNAARVLLERHDAALLAIGAAIDAPVARSASVNVATVLASVTHALRPAAREAGVNLRVARTHLWAYTDPEMLGRIVSNLVSNAISHSGANKVLVGARSQAGRLVIHVLDNGVGISDDELASLCQPGFRGRSSSSDGLGLGLYNVQLLAHALGGRVRIESMDGKGTRVRVRTSSFCGPAAEAARGTGSGDPVLAGQRIVLVSRDPVARQALKDALNELGATVADYQDVVSPALEIPYWKVAPDGFILDGASAGDEAFVKGLQLRFGPLRGAQIVPAEAPYVAPLAPEVLRLERPVDAGACAKIAMWFAG